MLNNLLAISEAKIKRQKNGAMEPDLNAWDLTE